MKYFKVSIKPVSPFGTVPMSDTIFGQLVWILSDMGEDVSSLLGDYDTNPFLVVSDFLPFGTGNTPKLPVKYKLDVNKSEKIKKIIERKKLKKKNRISLNKLYESDNLNNEKITELSEELKNFAKNYEIIRCSINRMTGTTGDGFDPYAVYETKYYRTSEYEFYFYVADEKYNEKVFTALETMGQIGFGKDASLGRGQFSVNNFEEVEFNTQNKNSIYTLGNIVLENIKSKKMFYEPFTRFGKHGHIRAVQGNPFKNPVVMALQGALIYHPEEEYFEKPFIGKALKGLSFYNDTVHQGYSLYIPVHLEEI